MSSLRSELQKKADPKQAALLQRYFKTGPGQYGEGDVFLGLKVGDVRKVAKEYKKMPFKEVQESLHSKFHEERLAALLILVQKFEKGSEEERQKVFDFYLKNAKWVNNWDLVDLSAPNIVGAYLLERDRAVLYKLARSQILWEKRISILATLAFIKEGQFEDTLAIAEVLLNDEHDLIHKAVGWMLRETGKRDLAAEERFLKKHCREMPRTMLRYAIEKFPEGKRQAYLRGNF
jgi:3-methyladenine DNA glycosylase AlkD